MLVFIKIKTLEFKNLNLPIEFLNLFPEPYQKWH